MTAVGDHRLMAHADAQYKTSVGNLSDGSRRRSHCHRIARPDIGNSGGNREALGMAKQISRMGKGIAARTLRYPESLVAMLLDRFRHIALSAPYRPSVLINIGSLMKVAYT